MKLVVALSGQGLLLGVRLLEVLRDLKVESHLILDDYDDGIWLAEAGRKRGDVESLAAVVHSNSNLAAPVASGSYQVSGMVIIPCGLDRVKTLARGYSKDLIGRAADVNLKEGRTLVLSLSATQLKTEDLQHLITLAEAGARVVPALPVFYGSTENIDTVLNQMTGRVLDRFGLQHGLYKPWTPSI